MTRAVLLALAALAVTWAWALSHNVPRGDDLEYMVWAQTAGWSDILRSPPPFPGVRPLNAAVWLVGAGSEGWANGVAFAVAALWLLALGAWTAWAHARAGLAAAAWMAALLLATPWFRDLSTWRSWTTSTGALAFAGLSLLCFERGRPWLAVGAGIAALGFREDVGLLLVMASLLVYRQQRPAVALALVMLPGFVSFAGHGVDHLPADPAGQLVYYLGQIGASVWLPVAGLAGLAPLAGAVAPLGNIWPATVGAVGVLGGIYAASRARTPWGPVLLSACVLPACYATTNPVYLLPAVLPVAGLLAGALAKGQLPPWVGAFTLAPAAWTWAASEENARWQWEQWTLANSALEARGEVPPRSVHTEAHAHDGGRFIAWWLEHQRGWAVAGEPQAVELCHGVTADR